MRPPQKIIRHTKTLQASTNLSEHSQYVLLHEIAKMPLIPRVNDSFGDKL